MSLFNPCNRISASTRHFVVSKPLAFLHKGLSSTTKQPRDLRICFIGDSFVNGTGDSIHLGWPGRLCALARRDSGDDLTAYNLGVRRDTSSDILNRWHEETSRRLGDPATKSNFDNRLVFSFGANDCVVEASEVSVCRTPFERSIENVRSICGVASNRWPTLFVGPPPTTTWGDDELNARIKRLDRAMALICDSLAVPFITVFDDLQGDITWKKEAAAGDGIHPGADGYSALSNLVYQSDIWRSWYN
jgi:acyl-CoA thioesterase-1